MYLKGHICGSTACVWWIENMYMMKVNWEQRHLFMLLYELQKPRSAQFCGITFLEFVFCIWILYSALARACEEDVLQRINIGLIHISFLEERIMMVMCSKWPMYFPSWDSPKTTSWVIYTETVKWTENIILFLLSSSLTTMNYHISIWKYSVLFVSTGPAAITLANATAANY